MLLYIILIRCSHFASQTAAILKAISFFYALFNHLFYNMKVKTFSCRNKNDKCFFISDFVQEILTNLFTPIIVTENMTATGTFGFKLILSRCLN